MDIRSIYLAHLGQPGYELYALSGQPNSWVEEAENAPYYLGWFMDSADALTGAFDVHQVLDYGGVPHLHVVGGHSSLHRASATTPWAAGRDVIDYVGGIPMFPITISNWSSDEIMSSGRWNWERLDDTGATIATGTGDWTYLSRWEYSFGGFHWDESYTQTHDNTGITDPFYRRIHHYDASGWMGFIDAMKSSATAIRKDCLFL